MIGGETGAVRDGRCATCGTPVTERERWAGERVWWSPIKHDAPCGAACMGGGVRPVPTRKLPEGVSGIAHAHRNDGCGTSGCHGGVLATAEVDRAVSDHDWQPDTYLGRPVESCAKCGQHRRRTEWGYVVRIFSEGRERQVSVRDGDAATPCSPFVRIV